MARCRKIPPATLFINSTYDPDAHLGKKRRILWTGYKVHLTETGEPTLPHLIVHVATTPAPRTDEAMTEAIEQELHRADVAPGVHLVDAGYVSARVLVNSQQRFGIEVLGPVSIDTQWQAIPHLASMPVSLSLIGRTDRRPVHREKRGPVGAGSAARAILI